MINGREMVKMKYKGKVLRDLLEQTSLITRKGI